MPKNNSFFEGEIKDPSVQKRVGNSSWLTRKMVASFILSNRGRCIFDRYLQIYKKAWQKNCVKEFFCQTSSVKHWKVKFWIHMQKWQRTVRERSYTKLKFHWFINRWHTRLVPVSKSSSDKYFILKRWRKCHFDKWQA